MVQWYLVLSIYSCLGGGGDPGIVQGACAFREQRVLMPSVQVCRQAKTVNGNSKCLGEVVDDEASLFLGTATVVPPALLVPR